MHAFGFRTLWRNPAFTAVAVLTLALGIGATTAIFTLVHAVLLNSLPVTRPGALYRIGNVEQCCNTGSLQDNWSLFSYEQYKTFRDNTPGFAELAAFQAGTEMVGVRRPKSSQPAQSMRIEFVSGNYFATFGISANAGRALTPDDDRKGAPPVAVISYDAWQETFGADPSVVGGTFTINNQPFTIIGIAPPSFFGDRLTNLVAFWIPIADQPLINPTFPLTDVAQQYWLDLIGRISPGADPKQISAHMQVELQQWLLSPQRQDVQSDAVPKQTLHLSPGGAGIRILRDQYISGLHLLMWISALVLAIACINVANLMLVRATVRKTQTSIQAALGAPSRARFGRRLSRVSCWHWLEAWPASPSRLPGPVSFCASRFKTRLWRFTLHHRFRCSPSLLAYLSSREFFLASLRRGSQQTLLPLMRSEVWAAPRDVLVGRKSRLSLHRLGFQLVLLASAWLLTQSFRNMRGQNFGFETSSRYVLHIDPQMAGYKPAQMQPLYRELQDSLAAIPGVSRVSFSLYTPMEGDNWSEFVYIEGQEPPPPIINQNDVSWLRVSAAIF